MSETAIRVDDLGKQYRVRSSAAGTDLRTWTLRDTLVGAAQTARRRMAGLFSGNGAANSTQEKNSFWALQDVSFDVKRGEIIGLIGRNGAGKSTLLKLLSRITEPTRGRIELNGRVASLLEVGTGFNGELSGRENIYLNGAILGMSHAEIRAQFDNIVSFAEVEGFVDIPVKRYSSGMFVRLAFAVAAHLQNEILIIDEVLAVGDSRFQRRCIEKMRDVAKSGHTVFLVSHQMQLVQSLATRALLLEEGKLIEDGAPGTVIARYMGQRAERYDLSRFNVETDCAGKFLSLSFSVGERVWPDSIVQGEPLTAHIEFEAREPLPKANLFIGIRNSEGAEVFSNNWSESNPLLDLAPGVHNFDVTIPTQYLRPDAYWLSLCLYRDQGDWVASLHNLEVPPVIPTADHDPIVEARRSGVAVIPCQWLRRS